MAKRSANDSLEKLKTIVEGNNAISMNLQTKMLRHINTAMKKTKPTTTQKEKVAGSSQFEKKMLVSPEMCKFAGWEEGCLKSRVEITKVIWDYVTEHNLKAEKNKRMCVLNEVLKSLLQIQEEEVSYPQIQKYIGKHLSKVESD